MRRNGYLIGLRSAFSLARIITAINFQDLDGVGSGQSRLRSNRCGFEPHKVRQTSNSSRAMLQIPGLGSG